MKKRAHLGIDVGGTFIDLVLWDANARTVHRGKHLSTSEDPADVIIEGINSILQSSGLTVQELGRIVHGTTLASNALIEERGAKVGIIATKGHRDTLEMGYEFRYDLYDLTMQRARPLVPRWLRKSVEERIDSEGNILLPLNRTGLEKRVHELASAGVDSLAICFLHSYRNPIHENQAKEIVEDLYPNLPVTLSSRVAPEIREFERFSSAVINSYVKPVVATYLHSLETKLKALGFDGYLYIMLSNGGVGSVRFAMEYPAYLVESGPAGGILAAKYFAANRRNENLIAFDMGGTTAKLSVMPNSQPLRGHQLEVARLHRFKRGSGLPLRIPVLHLLEIGAGGGSIAWKDDINLLKVGPKSAEARPGPVSYSRGGTEPTVTDADLVLGLLNPHSFAGGKIVLDADLALQSMTRLGNSLGLDQIEVALGIHTIVNENMAQAARVHLAERGADPRQFTLVATGGAGPVHAYGVARLLKIKRIICPWGAGVASAFGLLISPPSVDLVTSHRMPLAELGGALIQAFRTEMSQEAAHRLQEADVESDAIIHRWFADMRFVGQGFETTVEITDNGVSEVGLMEAFKARYLEEFGRFIDGVPIEITAWRLNATGPTPQLDPIQSNTDAERKDEHAPAERLIRLPGFGPLSCQVYDRYALRCGDSIPGPALVEEKESTIVIGPEARGLVDSIGNVVIEIEEF